MQTCYVYMLKDIIEDLLVYLKTNLGTIRQQVVSAHFRRNIRGFCP